MKIPVVNASEYLEIVRSPHATETFSPVHTFAGIIVEGPVLASPSMPIALPPCPVINIGNDQPLDLVDVSVDETQVDELIAAINAQPIACATLVQVLRHNESASITDGLLAESLAYSTLQHSNGFLSWLDGATRPSSHADAEPPLLSERTDTTLRLTFNRPAVHNAYSTDLKDALCDNLADSLSSEQTHNLELRGNGPSFCAGGDLSEFGSAQVDAGAAHLSRTTRSAGALLSRFSGTSSTHLHGACIGAGIELPAFTQRIYAHRDSFFQLPEVAMGLIPGAGGTVSITRRIGRHRTAWLALTNQRLNTELALQWGLIDELAS